MVTEASWGLYFSGDTMAEYGVQTWDASGKVNNYGIKPVSVCGFLQLAVNPKTGSFPLTFHRVAN